MGAPNATLADLARRRGQASTPIGDALGTAASSLLEWASRPSYMVGNLIQGDFGSATRNVFNFMVPGTQAVEAVAGQRVTPSMAIEQKGIDLGGGVLGFLARVGIDIATDPLTYLSLGGAGAVKGSIAGARALTATEQALGKGALTSALPAEQMIGGARLGSELAAARSSLTPTIALQARIPFTRAKAVTLLESERLGTAMVRAGQRAARIPGVQAAARSLNPAGAVGKQVDKQIHAIYTGVTGPAHVAMRRFSEDAASLMREIQKAGKDAGLDSGQALASVTWLEAMPDIARVHFGGDVGAAWTAVRERLANIPGAPALPDMETAKAAVGRFGDDVAQFRSKLEKMDEVAGVDRGDVAGNYLIQMAASDAEARKLETIIGAKDARKTREGYTRTRKLPTLYDWLLSDVIPETNIAKLLEARAHQGVKEARRAIATREVIRSVGVRAPGLDTATLRQMLDAAEQQVGSETARLAMMSGRVSTKEAQDRFARARQMKQAARDSLRIARKKGDKKAIAAAEKALREAVAAEKAIPTQVGRTKRAVLDVPGIREKKIIDALDNLDAAKAARPEIVAMLRDRIMGGAIERVRQLMASVGATRAGSVPPPYMRYLEARSAHETAMQEVARLEDEFDPLVYEIARAIRTSSAKPRAGGRSQNHPLARRLGKVQKEQRAAVRKGDTERATELQSEIDDIKRVIEADRGTSMGPVTANSFGGEVSAYAKRGSKRKWKESQKLGKSKRSIADYYGWALDEFARDPEQFRGLIGTTMRNGEQLTPEVFDRAVRSFEEWKAAREIADDLETQLTKFTDTAREASAEMDALFGADARAARPAAPDMSPEQAAVARAQSAGESVPPRAARNAPNALGAPRPTIGAADMSTLTAAERSLVKQIGARRGSQSFAAVKRNKQGFITVSGKPHALTMERLNALVDDGWLQPRLTADGTITGLAPGWRVIEQGKSMEDAAQAIRAQTVRTVEDAGQAAVTQAEDQLIRAFDWQPSPEQARIAELESEVAALNTEKQLQTRMYGWRTAAKAQTRAARKRLATARRTKDTQAIADATKALRAAEDAEKAARDALNLTRGRYAGTPTQIRAQTRRVDAAKKRANNLARKLARAEAYNQKVMFQTGEVVSPEEWAVVKSEWEKLPNRYAAETRIPPEAMPAVERMFKLIDPMVKDTTEINKAVRFLRSITTSWKALVLATPGYHIRNLMDDGLRAWWVGARNPQSFTQAIKMLTGRAGPALATRYGDYTAEELVNLAETLGIIRTGQYATEIPALSGTGKRLVNAPGKGRIVRASTAVGSLREDATRLGTFLELVKRGDDPATAALHVKEFLFDYSDPSAFVRWAKDFWSPFLTYASKAIPLTAKVAVTQPGRLANYALVANASQQAAGDPSLANLPPGAELSFAIPVPEAVRNFLGAPEGQPLLFDPANTFAPSVLNSVSPFGPDGVGKGIGRVIGTNTNPLIRAAVEIGTGYDLRSGTPLADRTRAPFWAPAVQGVLEGVSGGSLGLPNYGPKIDRYTGQTVPGYSTTLARVLGLFPPLNQAQSYVTAGSSLGDVQLTTGAETDRLQWVRTLLGLNVRPYDQAKAAFYASRRD